MLSSPAAAALEVWHAARVGAGEPPSPDRVARVGEKLADPVAQLVVVERAGQVVGMALGEQFRTLDGRGEPVPGRAHVSMVFVTPNAQGRGVGVELLETFIARSAWTEFSLWTRRSNLRAQALYRGRGFLPTGELSTTHAGAATERWQRTGQLDWR